MGNTELLRKYGLFDAKVPRYTSYPPANHFAKAVGMRYQEEWLRAVPDGTGVSIYIHIPFCKRLCWFCACRTQGTQTLRPVEGYLAILQQEIAQTREILPENVKMARLHLGGGTPTILTPDMMTALLEAVFSAFEQADDFEFSVEIDPTEAADDLLQTLADYNMTRASVGVQDFAEKVQNSIGRKQSLEETRHVIDVLRKQGVNSLNVDLLYGLPKQTPDSFRATLDSVLDLRPDRLAMYGYAHVPWMSKRQVMIKSDELPGPLARYALAQQAQEFFQTAGYRSIGIDHFALPEDSLSRALDDGRLSRNFQGYTTDTAPTLIGFGASAISQFDQGYVQNAVSTSAYNERVTASGLAGHKGYQMSQRDQLIARMVQDIMCSFELDEKLLKQDYPTESAFIHETIVKLMCAYPEALRIGAHGIAFQEFAKPLARIVAKSVDDFSVQGSAHSTAI